MFSDEDLRRAFQISFCLHQDREIAYEVTLDGIRRAKKKVADQNRRPASIRPNKQKLSYGNALRSGIFAASEMWEKDQESRLPLLRPLYKPTPYDLLSRYLKTLVWHSMDRSSAWVSIAIGHFLFSYPLNQIARVSPEFFDNQNMSRTRGFLEELLQERFQCEPSDSSLGSPVPVIDRPATDAEFRHIQNMLGILAPQSDGHPDFCAKPGTLLETYLFPDSVRSENDRIHSLISTECCGWARFVQEFNEDCSSTSGEPLADPRSQLRIPIFAYGTQSGEKWDRVEPDAKTLAEGLGRESLSSIELNSLRRSTSVPGPLIEVDDGVA
jgi:hypothetical protein